MQRVPLYGRRGIIRAYAKVDDTDYELVATRRWHLGTNGYAYGPEKELMHRVILGLRKHDGIYVDHRNGDTLDNRRRNLRMGTQQSNIANRAGANARSRSRYRGVTLDPRPKLTKRWIAQTTLNGRNHFLGRYATEEEAAEAARAFRREHMPDSRS